MNGIKLEVPFLDVRLSDVENPNNANELKIENLILTIRPEYCTSNVHCKRISEGYTNDTFVCRRRGESSRRNDNNNDNNNKCGNNADVVDHDDRDDANINVDEDDDDDDEDDIDAGVALGVRVYGKDTDKFIRRTQELVALACLDRLDCTTRLVAAFRNGFVYGFLPGKSLQHLQLLDFDIQKLVIAEIAKIHTVDIVSAQKKFCVQDVFPKEPEMFQKMKVWIDMLPSDIKVTWSKDKLLKELSFMERAAKEWNSPVVFCHNDLLPGNIIYCRKRNKVYLIDLEYSHPNYQAFDIATYFCEFAGMEEIDFSRYPSKEYQMKWLKLYVECFNGLADESKKTRAVELLYAQVNKFALVSHLYWAIWGLMQTQLASKEYGFLNFSQQRLNEFERRKEEFLNI